MTERTIQSGKTPLVIVRAGVDVVVKGWESDRVQAVSTGLWGLQVKRQKDGIEVSLGSSGQVLVPFGSTVKVYAGKNAEVHGISGQVSAVAGGNIRLTECGVLVQATAGRAMEIDCRALESQELKLSAGRDLRCWIRDLTSVRYIIDDLGGKWEAAFGDASTRITLKAGGDVTIVSDHPLIAQPADAIIGRIDRPA